jgi:hypothetical protein
VRPAHRAVYEILVGDVADGLDMDHLCRTPACVNPAHLEPVTHAVNMRRGKVGEVMVGKCGSDDCFEVVAGVVVKLVLFAAW